MAKIPIDLSQLVLERDSGKNPVKGQLRRPTSRWLTRYALPAMILLGLLALVISSAGHQFLPARSVSVLPVIVKKAGIQPTGSPLFQAPGWIEPRPTAISVAAMAPGVIEKLLVVAGQPVKEGEAIAKLVSVDAELTLEQAENVVAIRQGEFNRAQAELAAARARYENPVHLRSQLADAQSDLARSRTECATIPFLIEAAEANVKYAIENMEGKRSAKGAVSNNAIAIAENEYAKASANLKELKERQPNLLREMLSREEVVSALEYQLRELVDERRQLDEADAKAQSALAYYKDAQLQVRIAELTLERMTVRAPFSGTVLKLVAPPGTRVMGMEANAGQSSSTVVEMYDPGELQVRVDVRLEDIPMVTRDQPVDIETPSSPGVIHGRVLQVTSSANIQKNTLEVKVALINPPAGISPEMLTTATFRSPVQESLAAPVTMKDRVFVPRQLVQSSESTPFVWIVDEQSKARKRTLELDDRKDDVLVSVKTGLRFTDKLISTGIDDLSEGMRVRVTGDDQTLGIE